MLVIVYYSLSGTTAAAARKLADSLGAELMRIEDVRARRGIFGFIRSGYEASTARQPEIRIAPPEPGARQLSDYDGMVLLSPVWAGRISSPLRTFLNRYQESIGPYALAMVAGDPKNEYVRARADVEAICGRPAAAFASLCATADDFNTKLAAFGQAVQTNLPNGGQSHD